LRASKSFAIALRLRILSKSVCEPIDKLASQSQLNELRQLECDTSDDRCTERWIKGLRPGDFMKCFVKLSWVDKVKSQTACATWIDDVTRWMTRMSEADKCHTLLPEAVS
jgi:hypothetical protein